MPPIPPGGPSTVNGVLYQMLYSLLTLGGFRVLGHQVGEGQLEQVTLVLEPSSGGDQQALYPGKRVVTQLKARSTGGPWSLQEIVRGVLPDLYRAVDLNRPNSEYQFVTEGEQGRWARAEEFFGNLAPTPPTGTCVDALDDTKEIKFGRTRTTSGSSDGFWGEGEYTARRLFQKIVDTLRERAEVAAEPYEETCRKTWSLLSRFRFLGGITHEGLCTELDRWLLARIGPAERLSEKRDHLLLELGRLACAGNAQVEAEAFLKSSGLAETPLTQWARLSRKTHEHLTGVLRRKQVSLSEDVRPVLTEGILANWTTRSPLLVLTGETGSGKTWHGYRALLTAAASGDVAILVDSRSDADRDLVEAANTFWHRIVGIDEFVPFIRLKARLQRLGPENESRQVTVLVDNVSSPEEAKRLFEEDWEALGIRLAITCPPQVAEIIRPRLGSRGREIQVGDYTLPELQAFISRVVGIPWEDVPFDVQKTIKRPLLADLFGGLVVDDGWEPRNEYDLYEQAWESLRSREVTSFDIDGLRRAALGVLTEGIGYPWSVSDLRGYDLSSDAVGRLIKAGWLRETTGGDFEVWHDRMLNWTVAEAIACALNRDPAHAEPHLQAVAGLLQEPRIAGGRMLSYVPLDVMWLLAEGADNDLFPRLVTACESALGWRATEILHKDLLPTLGSRAIPLLLNRLRTATASGPTYLVNNVISGLVATGDDGLRGHAMELLASPDARLRRAGVKLVTELPTAEALDRLWAIHVEGGKDPEPYLWPNSSKLALYEETFDALKACVPCDLSWLERTILAAEPAAVPVHDLAYLLSSVGDEGSWRRCKQALFSKVDAVRERAIASCVLTFRDRDEFEWLEARVAKAEDMVGLVALRALTAMEPRRAFDLLDRLGDGALYFARQTCFAELHLHLPAEVMDHFRATLRAHERPLRYSLVLQGREDLLDPDSFDFLLDRLSEAFAEFLASGRTPDLSADCRTGVDIINGVARPELLDRLRQRRGSQLEQNLAEWAIALGPQEGELKVRDKFDALDALARIGGDGFNRVLDVWLERAGWGGRMHAVRMAQRRCSPRTAEILAELSESGGSKDREEWILGGYAAAALATHGYWKPVLRHYLRVGLQGLTVVEECCPEIDPPLDDFTLDDVLREFRGDQGPSPGAVLGVAMAARRDLLPEIRAALRSATPGSDLAGACLLALQWLRDGDPDIVPVIARHAETNNFHATNALLANDSAAADAELQNELRRRADLQLALILANNPRHRAVGIEAIRQLTSVAHKFRFGSGITSLVARACPEVLHTLTDHNELFAQAEEVGFSPYQPFRVTGEKPAALRFVGIKQPDAAVRMALARLRHPDTPDRELYVPVLGTLAGSSAVGMLLETVRLDPPSRVTQAIGRELGRLDAEDRVIEWLCSPIVAERLAACRIAGFLPLTERLDREVRARARDADRHVSGAAVAAHERLLSGRTVGELVRAVSVEADLPHRWTLLDTLVSVADPGAEGVPLAWLKEVRPYLTPALGKRVSERLKDRRKKLLEELDREDRRR